MPFYSGGSSPAVLVEFLAANKSFGSPDCLEFTSADYKAERSPIARQSSSAKSLYRWVAFGCSDQGAHKGRP